LAALAVAACAPGVAAAQSAALGGPDKPFTIGLQEVTAYDSNPARGTGTNAAIRGIESGEVIISPSVTAVYSHSVGLEGLALNANFGYDYHSKNTELNGERLGFSAIGNVAVGSRCSVGGQAGYNRSQSDLQNLTIAVTQNITQTYTLSGSESCHTAGGLTESVQLSHAATQNTNSSLVNYDVNGVSGLIGYTNPTIGTVGLTMSYNRTNYGSDPYGLGGTPEQMDVESVGVQLSRPFGARLTGTISLAYSHSSERARAGTPVIGATSFSGFTPTLGLTYLVGPRLKLTTNVARAVEPTLLEGVGHAVATNVNLEADYTVSSRIIAALGGSWSRTDYQGRDPRVILTTPGWQEADSFFARVTTTIGRRWGASLQYRFSQGRADLPIYNYVSNYVGLTLSTSF
jgi:hypothetical protein